MFRVLLSTVLMGIISLPQGMCLCHFFAPNSAHASGDTDDHDEDCPCCKLRHVLSSAAASFSLVHNEKSSCISLDRVNDAHEQFETIHSKHHLHLFRPLDQDLPLILCALRI